EQASATLLHVLPDDKNMGLVQVDPWGSESAVSEARRMNVNTGATTRVAREPIPLAGFEVDRKGNVRLSVGVKSDHTQLIHRRAASGGDWELVHDESQAGYKLQVLGFEDDDRHVLVARSQSRGADALYRWDIEENTQTKVTD